MLNGCREVQAKLRTMAARVHGADEAAITVDRGEVRIGERVLPIREVLMRGLAPLGGEVIGIGEMRKEAEPDHPLGGSARHSSSSTAPPSRSRWTGRPAT